MASVELTSRQRRFLRAAYIAHEASEDNLFFAEEVGKTLGYGEKESRDIADTLLGFRYMDHRELAKVGAVGGITTHSHPRGTGLVLTFSGREAARQLRDDEQAQRRALGWKIVGGIWAVAVTIAVPVCVNWLNNKIDRIEKQQLQPTTQPVQR